MDISGHVSELINSFTQHGNRHGSKLCDIYKFVIQTTVNSAIGLLSTVAGGFSPTFMPPGSKIDKLFNNPQIIYATEEGAKEVKPILFNLYFWEIPLVQGFTIGSWQKWQALVED